MLVYWLICYLTGRGAGGGRRGGSGNGGKRSNRWPSPSPPRCVSRLTEEEAIFIMMAGACLAYWNTWKHLEGAPAHLWLVARRAV
jgi:hypothetical protein